MRRGFTLVEAVVASGLATLVLGVVIALFAPAQRSGARVEERLVGVRAAMLVASRLEQDVKQAVRCGVEDGALVLDSGVQEVRWAHRAGGPVVRTVDGVRLGAPACRFARVAFEAVDEGAVRVTLESGSAVTFTVRTPVSGAHAYWRAAKKAVR